MAGPFGPALFKAELEPLADSFWSFVIRGDINECWPWNAGRTGKNYGAFVVGTRHIGTHRIAYALTHGDIPERMSVRHSCDNPPCCNPAHLILGTHKENMLDMQSRRRCRPVHGSLNSAAKLTTEQAAELIRRATGGEKILHLSREFGISCPVIRRILRGDGYKNVPRERTEQELIDAGLMLTLKQLGRPAGSGFAKALKERGGK